VTFCRAGQLKFPVNIISFNTTLRMPSKTADATPGEISGADVGKKSDMNKPGTTPDSGDILPRLETMMDSMTRAEVKIARRILAAPNDFVRASVRSAAADLGVSEPTILRFCRAVGCDGFKDLKFRLIQELALSQAMTDQSERATKSAACSRWGRPSSSQRPDRAMPSTKIWTACGRLSITSWRTTTTQDM